MSRVVVELSVPSDSLVVGSVLQNNEDLRIDLARFVPIGEAPIPYFWVASDHVDRFGDVVRADDRVASLDVVDRAEDRALYKIEWAEEPDGFLSAVADHDLVVESATGTADRWQFRLQGPDRERLSAFRDALREADVPVTVHRVWCPEVAEENQYGLTDVQRETLELAFERGYFEVPRDASLTDLGEVLEVSHQSVSRRIRGGLDNLLANTLMDESKRPR